MHMPRSGKPESIRSTRGSTFKISINIIEERSQYPAHSLQVTGLLEGGVEGVEEEENEEGHLENL